MVQELNRQDSKGLNNYMTLLRAVATFSLPLVKRDEALVSLRYGVLCCLYFDKLGFKTLKLHCFDLSFLRGAATA